MRFVSLLLPLLLITFISQAQTGVLTGSVKDADNNRPLAGATVLLSSAGKQAVTDVEGKFKISALNPGTYTLMVQYVGYDSKEISDVTVKAGDVTNIDISLALAKNTLQNVVVKTDARRENIGAVLNIRRNSAVVSDIISADMIKRSPDRNTSDVLKRVSGTTIQDNKFVLVRGMNDRYNEAMLNGALLPSSEPDRKTFAFDIFPSEVVDNITVIKSATPELPGSFSGGLIQINTKDVPDKNFIAFKVGMGGNSATTGKDFNYYKGGGSDWLGVDDGTRALPKNFPDAATYANMGLNKHVELAKKFDNNWRILTRNAPLTNVIQANGGFSLKPKSGTGPVFGGIFNLIHNTTFKITEYNRYDYSQGLADSFYRYADNASVRATLSSLLANFSLKLNANNRFFFNNIYSINATDQTVTRSGPVMANAWTDIKANAFFFTSNKIYNTQLGGTHYLPKAHLRIKWLGYLTSLKRDEPDYRRNVYFQNDVSGPYVALVTSATTANTVGAGVHYFANVDDKTKGLNVDLNLDFKMGGLPQTLKFGGAYFYNTRTRDARFLSAGISDAGAFDQKLYFAPQSAIFKRENFNATTGFTINENNDPKNHYDGSIQNTAGYIMLDDKLATKLRLVWGFRYESYKNIINTFNTSDQPISVDTSYNDFLPSANLIWSVLDKANIRLGYSNTVARPQYRELANQLFYDFLNNTTFFGNPYLTETRINNYEIRWEHYFPQAQYYSVSLFYKKFKNPIEPYIAIAGADSRTVGYKNEKTADVSGIELEARKNFDFIGKGFENLFAYANVSFIHSKTSARASKGDSSFRPLQGQSPYIINASLQYNEPVTNLGVSVLFNTIGPRLFLVGDPNTDEEPIWEKIHPTLDFKIIKSFAKNMGTIEFTYSDILHKNDYQYWDLKKAKNHDYTPTGDGLIQLQRFGYNLSLALTYRIQ